MSNAKLCRMEQLIAFVEFERKNNPGQVHIADWALQEIERLQGSVSASPTLRDAAQALLANKADRDILNTALRSFATDPRRNLPARTRATELRAALVFALAAPEPAADERVAKKLMSNVQWYADRTVDHKRHATHETVHDLRVCYEHIEQSARALLAARQEDAADALRFRWLCQNQDWHFVEHVCREVSAGSGAEFLSELRRVIDARRSVELDSFEQHSVAAMNKDAKVTEAMITAYLETNDAYWIATDKIPRPPGKWRTGTPREATRASLIAALAVMQKGTP